MTEGSFLRWLLLFALCGCGSVRMTSHPVPERLEVVGAFVYPFGFRWDEPAYRSFELSQRLIDVGIEVGGDQLAFWGPGEFKVMRADDDAAWVATTALPALTGTGARPDQGLVLRPWAERRVTSSLREAEDAKGRRAGAANSEETIFIGHIEVVHPSTHQVLLEAEAEVKVDPFAEAPPDADFDPAPHLTHLMEKLMRAVTKKISAWAPARTTTPLQPIGLAFSPAASLHFQDARPPADLEMAKMDSVSLDLFLQARARFLNPRLDDLTAAKLSKALPGLLVIAPSAQHPDILDGDLITTIDGQPAAPQVWSRLKFSPQVSGKVRRATGEIVEVLLP